jgi:tetratricopeptide (TPR) repeat protein
MTLDKKWFVHLLFAFLSLGVLSTVRATPRCEGKLLMSEIGRRQELTLGLLREKKFGELQQRMDGFLDAYVENRITDEELFYEFGAFDRWGPFLTPLFEEWLGRFPKSFAAHHGMSLHMSAIAWRSRGTEVASNTSEEQMREFDKKLRIARDFSLRSIALHPKPILAYQQLMNNAKALRHDDTSWTRNIISALFGKPPSLLEPRPDVLPLLQESIRLQPDNVIVRQAYVTVLAPKWGGTLDALQQYARPSSHPGMSPDRLASIVYAATMEIAADYWFRKELDNAVRINEVASTICRLNQPFVNIANIRLEQQRFADALRAAEAATEVVPGSTTGALLEMRALRGLGRHADVVRILKKLAPEGIPEISYLLGEYYLTGQGGLARDAAEARRLFEIAARGGDERAIKRLQVSQSER